MATRGKAHINGRRRHLGYCPQEDCSMHFLTVSDSLYLMARIRGVRPDRLASLVNAISSLFLLESYTANYIHQLSGGTKRRLHAALALIGILSLSFAKTKTIGFVRIILLGPPRLIILDEPTTGVDPNIRRQMQRIFLNAIQAKLSIILTSHSMDEWYTHRIFRRSTHFSLTILANVSAIVWVSCWMVSSFVWERSNI